VGGYALGRTLFSGVRLYGRGYECRDDPGATCYPRVIEETVVKIGWSEEYIIGERHPQEAVIFAKPDASNPTWFVIVVDSNTVYKNLSRERFVELVGDLGISTIEVQDALDVYRHRGG
jgi:hypothetical protein